MEKRRLSIWDIIAWIILAGIVLWLLLKVSGIINTPSILEYAPYFGAVYLAGWAMHKLETAVNDIKDLERFKDATIKEISNIKENCIKRHKK
mgnify:CR=1 FL=1